MKQIINVKWYRQIASVYHPSTNIRSKYMLRLMMSNELDITLETLNHYYHYFSLRYHGKSRIFLLQGIGRYLLIDK